MKSPSPPITSVDATMRRDDPNPWSFAFAFPKTVLPPKLLRRGAFAFGMPTTIAATTSPSTRTRAWTLARQALVASLVLPPLVIFGFYGTPILQVIEVVVFLGILLALAAANVWSANRWLMLTSGIVTAAFTALNLPFIYPELARPDHYPTYFVGWLAVITGGVGLTAGIAGFVDARRHRFGAPRWGGLGAAALLVSVGFAGGTMVAAFAMRYAPVSGAGTVAITPDATVSVAIAELRFPADPITVASGEIVRLAITNHDNELHTFTVDGLAIDADVGPGKTVDVYLQADAPGTYQLYCKPHSTPAGDAREGMVGTFIVT